MEPLISGLPRSCHPDHAKPRKVDFKDVATEAGFPGFVSHEAVFEHQPPGEPEQLFKLVARIKRQDQAGPLDDDPVHEILDQLKVCLAATVADGEDAQPGDEEVREPVPPEGSRVAPGVERESATMAQVVPELTLLMEIELVEADELRGEREVACGFLIDPPIPGDRTTVVGGPTIGGIELVRGGHLHLFRPVNARSFRARADVGVGLVRFRAGAYQRDVGPTAPMDFVRVVPTANPNDYEIGLRGLAAMSSYQMLGGWLLSRTIL